MNTQQSPYELERNATIMVNVARLNAMGLYGAVAKSSAFKRALKHKRSTEKKVAKPATGEKRKQPPRPGKNWEASFSKLEFSINDNIGAMASAMAQTGYCPWSKGLKELGKHQELLLELVPEFGTMIPISDRLRARILVMSMMTADTDVFITQTDFGYLAWEGEKEGETTHGAGSPGSLRGPLVTPLRLSKYLSRF
eukprot:gene5293-18537_t